MPSTASQPTASRRSAFSIEPAVLVLLAMLLAGFVLVVYAGRHLGFFFDEWNVVLDRRSGGLSTLLDAHNGHPVVLPVVVYRVLFELFGIDSYTPYRIAVALLHVIACAALFVLARRRIGAWAALVPTALLLFLGAAYQDLLWAFQMGYVGSVASGLLALVLLDGRRDAPGGPARPGGRGTGADVGACLLLTAAVAWSSIGIAFLACVAVELVLDPRTRRRLWLVAIPIVAYGSWYLVYGGDGDGRPQLDNVLEIPQYVLDSAAGAVAGIAGLSSAWASALLLFAVAAVWAARRAQANPPALSPRFAGLVVAVLLNWTLTALTRAQFNEPAASRYVYIGAAFLLPIAVELLAPPRRNRRLAAVAALLTVAAVVSNVGLLRDGQRGLRATWESVRASLTAVEVAGSATPQEFQPDPQAAPQVTAGRYLGAVAALGSPALTPGELAREPEAQRAQADRVLERAVPPTTNPVSGALTPAGEPLVLDGVPVGEARPWRTTCTRVLPAAGEAAVDLSVRPGASIELNPAAGGGPAEVRLRRFADAFGDPVASVPSRTPTRLTLPADGAASSPWHVEISAGQAFAVCPD